MTPIDTTAVKATVRPSLFPFSAGSVMISAAVPTAMTAVNGIRRWLTRLQIRQPGTAPSRLNAYIIRDALVMQLMPQNSWPQTAMMSTNLTQPVPIAFSNTANTVPPPWETALVSAAANVIASSTTQPISADQNTDCHTPLAADLAAPCVSSEMCAEASKPVIVYCVSRKPSGSTYHQNIPLPKPELF